MSGRKYVGQALGFMKSVESAVHRYLHVCEHADILITPTDLPPATITADQRHA